MLINSEIFIDVVLGILSRIAFNSLRAFAIAFIRREISLSTSVLFIMYWGVSIWSRFIQWTFPIAIPREMLMPCIEMVILPHQIY